MKPTREQFEEAFRQQLMSYEEMSEKFNCSVRSLQHLNEKYKVRRTKEENIKAKRIYLSKKLGVEPDEAFKTLLSGAREIFKIKTGVENPSLLKEVQEKRKQTFIKKYGVENPGQNEEIKKKIKSSFQKKYGENIVNPSQIPLIRKTNKQKTLTPDKNIEDFKKEIIDFLNSIGIVNIESNKEINIYIPEKKIGIEFNGNYWHSEIFLKQKYHQEKSLSALSNGIFLFNIFEYEWENIEKRNKIKNHLKNILLNRNRRIYARNCEIKTLTKTEKKQFLDDYHLQGNDHSIIEYGLFYSNKLVMVMTFCKARFIHGYEWELSRVCSKNGITVVGGAGKLFKYFVNNVMKTNEKVITYNDIGKTKGTVYGKIGFTKLRESKPSYVWFGHHEIKNRYKTQIKNEVETMQKSGYNRIFDCGNNVWSYTKQ